MKLKMALNQQPIRARPEYLIDLTQSGIERRLNPNYLRCLLTNPDIGMFAKRYGKYIKTA